MGDEPDTTVKPRSITRGRALEKYIDSHGRQVTIYPPAYAEGAERHGDALPKNWFDLGD